jgi:serine/threonine protein kinase
LRKHIKFYIASNGHIKIADFGSAKDLYVKDTGKEVVESRTQSMAQRTFVGSPAYVSPGNRIYYSKYNIFLFRNVDEQFSITRK